MNVTIQRIHSEPTRNKPYNDIVHIHGYYRDEFGIKQRCRCYIDPLNFNWNEWMPVIEEMANNNGSDFTLSGMKFKSRERGILTADCKPVINEIIPKQLKTTYVKPSVPPSGNLSDSELFTIED